MSRASDIWGDIHGAGGSIIGPDGTNLTANAEGQADFEDFLKGLCPNAGKLHSLLSTIEKAAADAAEMARYNAVPTTNPKCYSKPMVRLSDGCEAEYSMVPRNKNETSNCSGG